MRRRGSFPLGLLLVPFFLLFFIAALIAAPVLRAHSSRGSEDAAQSPQPAKLLHIRVVRLSFAEGTVSVRRPGSDQWAAATVNTPLQEGFTVATARNSFAEVEFENGSTVRLGEGSSLDFTQLALTQDGGHVNHLKITDGYATFKITPEHHDDFLLNVSGISLVPRGEATFRTDLDSQQVRVEVFRGELNCSDANQTEKLGKNHSLVRMIDSHEPFQISGGVHKDEWDKWIDARDDQASLVADNNAMALNAAMFGWDDLFVYGEWAWFPGFGYGWSPYASLGWSPYSLGMWSYYPNWGYTWISGEPWGWLPFHYGYWNYSAAMGWFWMPGSSFTSATWNPALVNWYTGNGWIGWSPVGPGGVGGGAPCNRSVAGCLTAVPPGLLRQGEPIFANNPRVVHPSAAEPVNAVVRPDVAPAPSAMLSGHALSTNASGSIPATKAANSAATFVRGQNAAPSTVVMGRQVGAATLEHHSFFGNDHGPIRVRLGGAMGGQLQEAAGGPKALQSRTRPSGVPVGMPNIRPQILSRGSVTTTPTGAGGFSIRPAPAQAGAALNAGSTGAPRGNAGGGHTTSGGPARGASAAGRASAGGAHASASAPTGGGAHR